MGERGKSALAGKTVVITRGEKQGANLLEELTKRGAKAQMLPLIAFEAPEDYAALDAMLKQVETFDWILFTSANAVSEVVKRSKKAGQDLNQAGRSWEIAAVGPATREAAERNGLDVDHMAKMHNGVALAEELGERLKNRRVLLPRSDRANADLPEALRRHGAKVAEVVAYRIALPRETAREEVKRAAEGGADAVVFFSPSAVHHFAELVGREGLEAMRKGVSIAAVGPVTAEALRKAGLRDVLVARDTTTLAVIEALEDHFAETKRESSAGAQRA